MPDSEQRASSSRKEIIGFPAPKKRRKKTYSLKVKIESIWKCYNRSKKRLLWLHRVQASISFLTDKYFHVEQTMPGIRLAQLESSCDQDH